jgi:tRNA-specific 2-thiouridylase
MKKVMVGMSGGVDSSVAAYLLKSEGYEVIGVTLKLCGENSDDIEDAKRVAKKIGIEHVSVDLSEEFRNKVINSFVDSYKNGETPNPCITCNKHIKFGDMLDFALESGMDFVATGHYASIVNTQDNRRLLLKSADTSKDQTYFLYSLTQEQLSRVIFPLGNLSKDQVRKIAEEQGFVNARKRDSQDICFVPGGDYASFIEKYTGISFPIGDFVDTNGKKLGEHKGIIKYTVGQRKGLGIALGKPAFVCAKNVDSNTVVLGENEDLFSMELVADNVNLIPFDKIDEPIRVGAKIRYNQKEQPALVESIGEGAVRVAFDEPQRAVSKGQSVVFYSGNSVVGGGIIR